MTKELSGSWLKMIAMLSMTTDHLAYYYGCENPYLYELMRTVGRIAFPTFAFLLAEGFVHTRDKSKYMINLFVFALLSEVPWMLLNHIFYMFRGRPDLQTLFGIPLMYEYGIMGIMMAFAVIWLYNGERGFIRGKAWKYAFYAFYPVHLMLIYCLR